MNYKGLHFYIFITISFPQSLLENDRTGQETFWNQPPTDVDACLSEYNGLTAVRPCDNFLFIATIYKFSVSDIKENKL
jgi:hypothetical protein